jgi:CRISPR-associated protein Cas1
MSRHYYLTKNGRLRRQDNTLYFETDEQKRPIPVDDVESLFLFGELDLNTKLLNFLAQKHIPVPRLWPFRNRPSADQARAGRRRPEIR